MKQRAPSNDSDRDDDLETLEGALGHGFRARELLLEALTHRSYRNEHAEVRCDNERLEFLGDAVLQLGVSVLLMARCPEYREGQLSLTRSQVVSEPALAQVGEAMGLGRYLRLGRGEARTGGRHKPSLVADALEALIGAVYQDAGPLAAQAIVARLFEDRVARVVDDLRADFKSRLQEVVQAGGDQRPRYQVLAESGPVHQRVFEVAVLIGEETVATGMGRSKREAEQRAAELALAMLAGGPVRDEGSSR